jgi:hypothetical protein
MRRRFSFSLGQYTKEFQPDIYAIKACADANIKSTIKRGYWKKNIYIVSDRQATIKVLNNCKINSKLDWDCGTG